LRKKTLWIVLVLLAAAIVASPAHADVYQYTFDLSPFIAPSTPVVFDTTGPIALNTSYSVLSGTILTFPITFFEVTSADLLEVGNVFASSLASFTPITSGSEVIDDASHFPIGTLSATDITPTSTPEPNSLGLLLMGLAALGILAAVSRRKSLGASLAS
jgi:hypothetical protein